jgi:hypothetical protein
LKYARISLGLFLCLAFLFTLSQSASTEKTVLTHTVNKGDTLWSICERYYSDPYLWPELWEMNKFITNPHWLKPGDVITLLEQEQAEPTPIKEGVPPQEVEPMEMAKKPVKPKKPMGINVSNLTNMEALGFLRQNPFEPWGRIFDFETEKVLAGEGDVVYVKMHKQDIRAGDAFTIYNISPLIKHPLTEKEWGYIHTFKGVLLIEGVKEDYYVARIRDSFRAINKDDLLMPYHSVSPCVLPIPYQGNITAHVIASKDNLTIHGQYSVVYIDMGFKKGVRRGNIFKAIEERESRPDPKNEETVSLPPAVIGKILILATTERTAAGVVFESSKDFANGVKVQPVTWREEFSALSNLPTCPFE